MKQIRRIRHDTTHEINRHLNAGRVLKCTGIGSGTEWVEVQAVKRDKYGLWVQERYGLQAWFTPTAAKVEL